MMWTPCPSGPTASLYAQFRFDLELTLIVVALIALLVAGGMAIVWIRGWRREQEQPTMQDQLASYRRLVDEGLLDPSEFARIQEHRLAKAQQPKEEEASPFSPSLPPGADSGLKRPAQDVGPSRS